LSSDRGSTGLGLRAKVKLPASRVALSRASSAPVIKSSSTINMTTTKGLKSGISFADEPQDSLVPPEVEPEAQEEQASLISSSKMSNSPRPVVDANSNGAVFHDSDSSKPPAVSTSIIDLPEEVLALCLSFVGPGQYRYMAGTCHSFRDAHNSESFRQAFNMEEGAEQQKTTWDSAAASIQCVQLCSRERMKRLLWKRLQKRQSLVDKLQC